MHIAYGIYMDQKAHTCYHHDHNSSERVDEKPYMRLEVTSNYPFK